MDDKSSLVLLGIRSSTRDDSAISPAHLVYVGPLRLPGEFFPSGSGSGAVQTSDFVAQLQHYVHALSPIPIPADFHAGARVSSVPGSLSTCLSVFVRVDAVKRPLTQPYTGPYEVLRFLLLCAGRPWTVTVDRLKPLLSPVMSAPPQQSSASAPIHRSPATQREEDLPDRPSRDTVRPSIPANPRSHSHFGSLLRPPDHYSP